MDRDISHYPGLLQPGIGCWYGKFWLVQHNSLNRTSKKSHGSRWESTLTSRRRAPECRGCNFPGHWWISFPRKSSRRDRTGDGQGKKHKNPRMGFQPHPFPWVVPNPIPLPNQIILGIRRPFGKAGNLFQVEFIARRKKKIKEEIQFHLEDFTWIYRDPPSQSHPKIPWKKHPGQVFSSLLPDFPLSADLFFKEWLGNGARGMEWAARHSFGWDQPQENSHPRGNLGSDFGLFEDLHGKAPFCSFLLFNPWELLKFLRNETLPFQIHFKKWRKIQKWLEFLHLFFHVFHIYFPYSIHDFHMFFHIFSYLFIIFP